LRLRPQLLLVAGGGRRRSRLLLEDHSRDLAILLDHTASAGVEMGIDLTIKKNMWAT